MVQANTLFALDWRSEAWARPHLIHARWSCDDNLFWPPIMNTDGNVLSTSADDLSCTGMGFSSSPLPSKPPPHSQPLRSLHNCSCVRFSRCCHCESLLSNRVIHSAKTSVCIWLALVLLQASNDVTIVAIICASDEQRIGIESVLRAVSIFYDMSVPQRSWIRFSLSCNSYFFVWRVFDSRKVSIFLSQC